jgi:arabinose-5-phosphate isomerase
MVSGSDIPTITPTAALANAIFEMTHKGLGMTTIASEDRRLLGIFTDGDLRRAVENGTEFRTTPLTEVMTSDARTVHQELLAAEAMALMERHQISALVVVDDQNTILGVVTLLALLKAGIS